MKLKRKSDGRIYYFKGIEECNDCAYTLIFETEITINNKKKKVKRKYTYYYWEDILSQLQLYEEVEEV